MTSMRAAAPLIPILIALTGVLMACGSDGEVTLDLTPAGEAGRQVAQGKGCAACHGGNGQGGVGPTFEGLFGKRVEFDDGTTIVADEAYIVESITDPAARRVDGYTLPMPETNLSDDEIASIVTYIRELSQPATTGATP